MRSKSERLHNNKKHIERQKNILKSRDIPVKDDGRYSKQHALDCGNPQCKCCSPEKVFGIKSIKEKIADDRMKDM